MSAQHPFPNHLKPKTVLPREEITFSLSVSLDVLTTTWTETTPLSGLCRGTPKSYPLVSACSSGSLKGYPGGKTWLFSINFSFQEWLQGKEGDIGQRLWGLISNSIHLPFFFFFSPLFFFPFQIQKQRVFPLYFSFTP